MNKVSEKGVDVEIEIEIGQIYKGYDDFWIFSKVDNSQYALISLSSGNRWLNPRKNKQDVFGLVDFDKFKLVKVEIVIKPNE